jgi:hypothetical protein
MLASQMRGGESTRYATEVTQVPTKPMVQVLDIAKYMYVEGGKTRSVEFWECSETLSLLGCFSHSSFICFGLQFDLLGLLLLLWV